MTREEFEVKYAMKYLSGDFTHNPTETLNCINENRNGEGYTDHHIDLCWKVQRYKNNFAPTSSVQYSEFLEW